MVRIIEVHSFKYNYEGWKYYKCIISKDLYNKKLIWEIIKFSSFSTSF